MATDGPISTGFLGFHLATDGPISTGSLGYQTTDGSGVDQATGEPVSEEVVVVAEEVTGSVTDVVTEREDEFLNLSPRFIKFFKFSPITREIKVMAIVCLCLAYGNFNHLSPTRITEPGNSHRFVKELAQVIF